MVKSPPSQDEVLRIHFFLQVVILLFFALPCRRKIETVFLEDSRDQPGACQSADHDCLRITRTTTALPYPEADSPPHGRIPPLPPGCSLTFPQRVVNRRNNPKKKRPWAVPVKFRVGRRCIEGTQTPSLSLKPPRLRFRGIVQFP